MTTSVPRVGTHTARSLFEPAIMGQAVSDAFRKLHPRYQVKNPVMFVVWVGSIVTTLLFVQAVIGNGEAPAGFILSIALWLWFTVLFANFAEAMAEGRGKAQADSLRRSRQEMTAKRLGTGEAGFEQHAVWNRTHDEPDRFSVISANELKKGDVVLVEANDFIPADGEVIEGVASVNESAITGESAPVIRESGGDRSAVTGGTKVLSDWLVVRITASPGETFLDGMIAMVEGAKRQKTPNEIGLNILLAALTIIFLLATVTVVSFAGFRGHKFEQPPFQLVAHPCPPLTRSGRRDIPLRSPRETSVAPFGGRGGPRTGKRPRRHAPGSVRAPKARMEIRSKGIGPPPEARRENAGRDRRGGDYSTTTLVVVRWTPETPLQR